MSAFLDMNTQEDKQTETGQVYGIGTKETMDTDSVLSLRNMSTVCSQSGWWEM